MYFSCIYRFEAQKDERVKLVITKVIIKGRHCQTVRDPDMKRFQCHGNASAALRFYEVPGDDAPAVPRDCFCSTGETQQLPFTYVSSSNVAELRFDVTGMNATDDFTTLFFEGTWKFIRTPTCKKNMRIQGPSGALAFYYPSETADEVSEITYSSCENGLLFSFHMHKEHYGSKISMHRVQFC